MISITADSTQETSFAGDEDTWLISTADHAETTSPAYAGLGARA